MGDELDEFRGTTVGSGLWGPTRVPFQPGKMAVNYTAHMLSGLRVVFGEPEHRYDKKTVVLKKVF